MHSAAIALAPVLAAEKSKVPFYIAGGALAVWAVVVSMVLGMRRPAFPGGLGGQRTVIAITAVLVLAAVATAVSTSSPPPKTATVTEAASRTPPGSAAPSTPGTAPPVATTGTPAPPSSPAHKGAAGTVALAANPSGLLSYTTKQLSVKAGVVTINFANASPVEHNVTIAEGTKVLGATPTFTGGARTLTLALKPGTYTFYCTVPGHRQAGMEGTLSVT